MRNFPRGLQRPEAENPRGSGPSRNKLQPLRAQLCDVSKKDDPILVRMQWAAFWHLQLGPTIHQGTFHRRSIFRFHSRWNTLRFSVKLRKRLTELELLLWKLCLHASVTPLMTVQTGPVVANKSQSQSFPGRDTFSNDESLAVGAPTKILKKLKNSFRVTPSQRSSSAPTTGVWLRNFRKTGSCFTAHWKTKQLRIRRK